MPLSRRYYNLIGLFDTRRSFLRLFDNNQPWMYSTYAWTIKRKGPNLVRTFKPTQLSTLNVKQYLDEVNMPKEARWFYVESIKVITALAGEKNQNYVKGQGHDDVTTSPIPVIHFRDLISPTGSFGYIHYFKGLACTPSEETFNTIVNGRTITKHKLEVETRPSTDVWWSRVDVDTTSGSLELMGGMLIDRNTTYSQPILDEFSRNGSMTTLPKDWEARLGGRTMLPEHVGYTPPIKIDWSFIGRPLNTRNYLRYKTGGFDGGTGLTNYFYDFRIPERFDFTGVEDNRYPIYSYSFANMGVRTVRRDSYPLFNRYRYQLPSVILPVSTNEEEDYNVMNQNYSRAYRTNNLLSLLFDAAGLINPLTFTATFVRMMINISDLYVDYINEEARINDSQNNFEGFDMPFYYKIEIPDSINFRSLTVLESGQTQTITMPTRKIEFMENGERTYETENRFIELPVNKLFKSTSEFINYLRELDFTLSPGDGVYVKLEPYMEFPEFGEAHEIWAKIGGRNID